MRTLLARVHMAWGEGLKLLAVVLQGLHLENENPSTRTCAVSPCHSSLRSLRKTFAKTRSEMRRALTILNIRIAVVTLHGLVVDTQPARFGGVK